MNPQLSQYSDMELKAFVYDLSNQMQAIKMQIDTLNQEITERSKVKKQVPPDAEQTDKVKEVE